MSANYGSTTMRNSPDVAMVADNIFIVWNNGSYSSVGGTSAASPLWASFTALVNQQAAQLGKQTVGFINPGIYAIGKGSLYGSRFHDITSGNNLTPWNTQPNHLNEYYAQSGYDLCTGWGTPIGANLINALSGVGGATWVDFNYTGSTQNGSYDAPFKTLAGGTNAVNAQGAIFIKTAGSTAETMTISKPMTIVAVGGAATIGH